MKCYICKNDQWENVDEFRDIKKGMSICKKCGFVTYPDKYEKKKEILEYYRHDYRPGPKYRNLETGTNKLRYHAVFLKDMFKEWIDKKFDNPVILEVGAAFGLFLNNIKCNFPNAQLNGTELTLSFRKVASQEFGINLTEEIDTSKKYDLISSYKVLEHQFDPDLELKKYHEILNDDGYLYLSIPTWFVSFSNFGIDGADLEYYYHPDHINTWTEEHIEYLIKKYSFEIVKKDNIIYGSTYLLKKSQELQQNELPLQYDFVKASLKKIHDAYVSFQQKDFKQAIEIFPNYPIAWQNHYEKNRQIFDQMGIEGIDQELLHKAIKSCNGVAHIYAFAGDICARYEAYDKAVNYIEQALIRRPDDSRLLMVLAQIYLSMGNKSKNKLNKSDFFKHARMIYRRVLELNPALMPTCIDWIYYINENIPLE